MPRRILALLPREERWRARLVCRGLRTAVHGMQDLAFWLALTAGPLSGPCLRDLFRSHAHTAVFGPPMCSVALLSKLRHWL